MYSFESVFVEILRLTIWLVLLVIIFVPLEQLFAQRPNKILRPQIGLDLCYYVLSSLLPAILLSIPLAIMALFIQWVVPSGFHAMMQGLPIWLALLIGLITADIGSYWGHRLSHEIPFLWKFHSIHHSSEHLDFLSNGRAHPLDLIWVRLWGYFPLYLLGLGSAGAEGSLIPVIVSLVGTIASFFVHANVRFRFGFLEWLISSPAFHHWHHTKFEHINRNYAANFPWIDRLFGTHYLPDKFPDDYGIDEPMPEDLMGQLMHPFESKQAESEKKSDPESEKSEYSEGPVE